MKLGVFTAFLGNENLNDVLKYVKSVGVDAVEIGTGGYPGKGHLDPSVLLKDKSKIKEILKAVEDNGLIISALSVHGNPVHPDKQTANEFHNDFKNTVLLASEMGVERIVTFSGCPGDSAGSKYPNWVTCPWPEDFLKILDFQWNEVLIPYWADTVSFANANGIDKICLEMHPGFCVYNPETLIKLRNAVGKTIGSNFDPSHLVWQGMDPVAAIRSLGDAVYHFHAKDVRLDKPNMSVNGVLDTKHYGDEKQRSWVFRTCGYGTPETLWRDMMSELRLIGYDYVVSIEHEDSLMTPKEGFEKAASFLNNLIINDPKPTGMAWA